MWGHASRRLINMMAGDKSDHGCFGRWKYSHYFLFVSVKEKNITVKCNLCPGDKRLSTALDSTSQHEQVKLVARDHYASTEGQTAPTQIEYLKSRLNWKLAHSLQVVFIFYISILYT